MYLIPPLLLPIHSVLLPLLYKPVIQLYVAYQITHTLVKRPLLQQTVRELAKPLETILVTVLNYRPSSLLWYRPLQRANAKYRRHVNVSKQDCVIKIVHQRFVHINTKRADSRRARLADQHVVNVRWILPCPSLSSLE